MMVVIPAEAVLNKESTLHPQPQPPVDAAAILSVTSFILGSGCGLEVAGCVVCEVSFGGCS